MRRIVDSDGKYLVLDDGTVIAKAGLRPDTVQRLADGGFVLPGYPEKPQPVAPPAPPFQTQLTIPSAARAVAETAAGFVSPTSGSPGAAAVAGLRSLLPGSPGYKEELTRYNEAAGPGIWTKPASVMESPLGPEAAERTTAVVAGTGPRAPFDVPGPAGFVSALDRAVEGVRVPKMSAQQWRKTLSGSPGVTAEELTHREVENFLRNPLAPHLAEMVEPDYSQIITKEQLQAHLRGTPMSRIVQDKLLGAGAPVPDFGPEGPYTAYPAARTPEGDGFFVRLRHADGSLIERFVHRNMAGTPEGARQFAQDFVNREARQEAQRRPATHYHTYFEKYAQDPDTYHEVLVNSPTAKDFQGHFGGEGQGLVGNMIAARRTLSDGTPTYGVFEWQSDLHKAGRDTGYQLSTDAERQAAAKAHEAALAQLEDMRGKLNAEESVTGAQAFLKAYGAPSGWRGKKLVSVLRDNLEDYTNWTTRDEPTSMWSAQLKQAEPFVQAAKDYVSLFDAAEAQRLRVDELGTRLNAGVPHAIYKGNAFDEHMAKRAVINAINQGLDTVSWQTGETVGKRWSADSTNKDYGPQYNERMPSIFKKILGKDAVGQAIIDRGSDHLYSDTIGPGVYRIGGPRGAEGVSWLRVTDADLAPLRAQGMPLHHALVQFAKERVPELTQEKVWTARISPEARAKILKEGLSYAHGGVVNPMRETDTHFHVGSFRISKKGLNAKTLKTLQLKLAEGGEVPNKDGEFALPPAPEKDQPVAKAPGKEAPIPAADLVPQTPAANDVITGDLGAGPTAPMPPTGIDPSGSTLDNPPPADPVGQWVASAAKAIQNLYRSPTDIAAEQQAQAAASQPPLAAAANPPAPTPTPQQPLGPGLAPPPAPPWGAAGAKGGDNLFDRTGAWQTYARGTADLQKAQAMQVPFVKQFAEQSAGFDQQKVDLSNKAATEITRIRDEGLAQGKQIYDDIMSSKIDPKRLWNDASTPQKIMGSIGILLSGIGSGLTGQPNLAMQLIDRAIERDIDAQKAELGKKKSMLSWVMERTNNEMQARFLVRGLALDAVSAQLDKAKNELTGNLAQSNFLIAKATIDREKALARDQFANTALGQYNAEMNYHFAKTKMQLLSTMASPGGMLPRSTYAAANLFLDPKEKENWGLMPTTVDMPGKDAQGNPVMIKVPTSQHFTSRDPKAAEQAFVQIGMAEGASRRLRILEEKWANRGTIPIIEKEARQEAQAAKTILEQVFISGGVGIDKPYRNLEAANEAMLKNPAELNQAWFHGMRSVLNQVDQAIAEQRRGVMGTIVLGAKLTP